MVFIYLLRTRDTIHYVPIRDCRGKIGVTPQHVPNMDMKISRKKAYIKCSVVYVPIKTSLSARYKTVGRLVDTNLVIIPNFMKYWIDRKMDHFTIIRQSYCFLNERDAVVRSDTEIATQIVALQLIFSSFQ